MRVLRRMAVDPHWSRRQVKPVKSVVPEIFRSEITLFFWFGCNVSESYIASKKLGAIGQKAVTPQACSLIGGAMAFEELYNARNKRIIFISGTERTADDRVPILEQDRANNCDPIFITHLPLLLLASLKL
jgi:hypothetical protein